MKHKKELLNTHGWMNHWIGMHGPGMHTTSQTHLEQSEFGELTYLRWHRLQLVALELKMKGGDEAIPS